MKRSLRSRIATFTHKHERIALMLLLVIPMAIVALLFYTGLVSATFYTLFYIGILTGYAWFIRPKK